MVAELYPRNPWLLRATGAVENGMVADAAEVRRAIELFADPAAGCELVSIPHASRRTAKGADVDGLCESVKWLRGGAGIYFRVNPVPSALEAYATDEDVLSRRWLYVDVDPIKPDEFKDDPATDAEKSGAGTVCDSVNGFMQEQGWPAPVIVDSGNGYGMFWRCDLPNEPLVKATYQRWVQKLGERFPTGAKIDPTIFNACRLAKLPGTWAKKGRDLPDRPHRPCRIVYRPAELVPVTMEQLSAAAGPVERKSERNGTYTPPSRGLEVNSAYGRKALDAECSRVVFANQRNNALNAAAFSLGQLVAGGVLDEAEVSERLADAARQAGLDRDKGCGEKGIAATIRSGLKAGKKEPRGPKPRNDPRPLVKTEERDKLVAEAKAGEKRLTVKLSAVKPLKVDWLVPSRVPKRFITIFAGQTGVGKSFVSLDLIARLTTGGEIPGPGGLCFEPGGVLIISEDSHEYVLAPRLIGLGADMSRINAMTWEAMGNYHLSDTEMLNQACNEVEGGVSLVLIDPPTNFLDDVDEHKNSEVRQLVMKVVQWSFTRDLAVLFVLHVNKQANGVEAINRIMGSVAWVSTSRIAHSFCRDPDDSERYLWMPIKSNLGPIPKGLAYRVAGDPPVVEWLGEVDLTADEAMSGTGKTRKRSVVASEWLIEKFRQRLEWNSDDLIRDAKQNGISRNALFQAKELLELKKPRKVTHESGDVTWMWWVPKDWPPLAPEKGAPEQ